MPGDGQEASPCTVGPRRLDPTYRIGALALVYLPGRVGAKVPTRGKAMSRRVALVVLTGWLVAAAAGAEDAVAAEYGKAAGTWQVVGMAMNGEEIPEGG